MNQRLLIRYTVKPEHLAEHLDMLRAVYAELEATGPHDFRLTTYRLDDDYQFVDVAVGPDLPGPLAHLESFQRYRAALEDRCEERAASELTIVGSYRLEA